MMRIVPFDGDRARWDAVVRGAGDASYTQLAGWRDVMTDALGHETLFQVACDDGGDWCAVLPLVRVRAPLLGHYLISMPFMNAGGAVGDSDGVTALGDWAIAEARRSRADLLELRGRTPMAGDLRPEMRKITVRLPLASTPDAMFNGFPAKLRSQIRRPIKAGYEARFGENERDAFYEVFAHAMRGLGTPVLPAKFFGAIDAALPGMVEFGVVYRGDIPVAAGCGFAWRNEFELHWAGSVRAWQRDAPNMLLYWAFMERMIARGVRIFDFGRCTVGSSTHHFKRQWGGADVGLPWAQWSPRDLHSPPRPDQPVFRVASAVWRHLPLAVANIMGPPIARCLP